MNTLGIIVAEVKRWIPLIPAALIAIGIVIAAAWVARLVRRRQTLFSKVAPNQLLAGLLRQTLSTAILIAAVVLGLDIVGAGSLVGAVLGMAGVLGLGVSFAFKDIIENYIAGVLLSIKQPFRKGDHIVIDDSEGLVQRMDTRMTMIKSFDGNNISIPNAIIFKARIINYTTNPERRFQFAIGIDAEADPNDARKIGLLAMQKTAGILAEPPTLAIIDDVGDSSIALRFFGWVNQTSHDYFLTRSAAIRDVKMAIETAGIAIPEPIFTIKLADPSLLRSATLPSASKAPSQSKAVPTDPNLDALLDSTRKEDEGAAKHLKLEEKGQASLLNSSRTE